MSTILLKVQLPGSQSKTLKFETSCTIANVIQEIEKKLKLPHDPLQAIYLTEKSIFCQDSDVLSKLALKNMVIHEQKQNVCGLIIFFLSFPRKPLNLKSVPNR